MSGLPVADDVLDADVPVLSLSEVADELGTSTNKVRQMLRDGLLIAVRRKGELHVPKAFFVKDGVLKGLSGTITVLDDSGFTRTEMLRWLFAEDETLPGGTPVHALRTSHGTEVKRRAQAMAF
ncbi:Rv2175c family DNA-binding protein [Amycolatopsis sp. H20-H5]|uniref:Rv2175c family DNA-binding protein n=1 Tax=Amycolatopsis sp. H20-H5 TaxID=3046309 RepID=UPI002DBB029B|nr:Rv2175c family DNA-binding protein [Amycolatopsis sp. H20-H5]MEC3980018.1 Rv2175c family DNA-binding protein [Amycolatopsis sp. H20-H5]